MSSHHCIVTRSPNHWCAISCAMILRDLLARARRAAVFADEEKLLAKDDRAGVLHRAGGEVGHRDDVELLERIFDGEVAIEIPQRELRRLEREAELVLAIRRAADAYRNAIGAAGDALPIADAQRDEVGRHALGRGELSTCVCRRRARAYPTAGVRSRSRCLARRSWPTPRRSPSSPARRTKETPAGRRSPRAV